VQQLEKQATIIQISDTTVNNRTLWICGNLAYEPSYLYL